MTSAPPPAGNDPLMGYLTRLAAVSQELAAGDFGNVEKLFSMTGASDLPGEAAELAESFGMMFVKLEAREFQLQNTIEELRETQRQLEAAHQQLARENVDLKQRIADMKVEIDEAKRAEHVSEIVDSDYFRDLQARARQMRERGRQGR